MISVDASPRSPRKTAEDLMRRGYLLGDDEMVARGRQVLKYAEEQESRRTVEHDRFGVGSPMELRFRRGGQVVGFLFANLWLLLAFFDPKTVLLGYAVFLVASASAYAAYCAIRRLTR